MDTHVNPSIEVPEKYVDPGFRPRLEELKPYYSVRQRSRLDGTIQTSKTITVAPIPYDRFPGEVHPNFRTAVAEVGHGWLPQWVIRLGQMMRYVSGTTPALQYPPIKYVQQGRFKCAAEPFEGPEMTKACIDILGDGVLMHQSDYPHGEAYFPDTAGMVSHWPIWSVLGEQALRKHMYDNAATFLRLV